MDLFNKVYISEPMKVHIYEPNISLISLISQMFNYAKTPNDNYTLNKHHITLYKKATL